MKFLGKTLSLIFKLIFIIIFVPTIVMLSLIHTYLDKDYYKEEFSDKLIKQQTNIISKEDFNTAIDNIFYQIENYEDGSITLDLSGIKNNIEPQIALPSTLDIDVENTNIGQILTILKTTSKFKLQILIILTSLLLIPLIGIILLNMHPISRGFKKVGITMAIASILGLAIILPFGNLLQIAMSTLLLTVDSIVLQIDSNQISELIEYFFSDLLNVIKLYEGSILISGITLVVLSKIIKKKYENSY